MSNTNNANTPMSGGPGAPPPGDIGGGAAARARPGGSSYPAAPHNPYYPPPPPPPAPTSATASVSTYQQQPNAPYRPSRLTTTSSSSGTTGATTRGGGGRGGGERGNNNDSSSIGNAPSRPSLDSLAGLHADEFHGNNNNTATTTTTTAAQPPSSTTSATSPFLQGLLRFSPTAASSAGATSVHATPHYPHYHHYSHHHHHPQPAAAPVSHHPQHQHHPQAAASVHHLHYQPPQQYQYPVPPHSAGSSSGWSHLTPTAGPGGSAYRPTSTVAAAAASLANTGGAPSIGRPRARFFDTPIMTGSATTTPRGGGDGVIGAAAAPHRGGFSSNYDPPPSSSYSFAQHGPTTTAAPPSGLESLERSHSPIPPPNLNTTRGLKVGNCPEDEEEEGDDHNNNDGRRSASAAAAGANDTTGRNSMGGGEGLFLDGIPIHQLRQLAKKSLLQLPTEQAGFYASLVHAKTKHPDDALLLAQAHLQAQKYTACLRVLEESRLIRQPECSSPQAWEALLLACNALAATDEWTKLVELLEDACRIPSHHGSSGSSQFARLTIGLPLEDDDELGWQTLQQHIRQVCPTTIAAGGGDGDGDLDPLARLCWWRAQGYHETGHTVRAARFWKRALLIDPFCQPAWEALLKRHLLTPKQAHELCQTLPFGPNDEWLRALYVARIEVTPLEPTTTTTTTTAVSNSNQNQQQYQNHQQHTSKTPTNFGNTSNMMQWQGGHLDASSIQISSPVPKFASPEFGGLHPPPHVAANMAAATAGGGVGAEKNERGGCMEDHHNHNPPGAATTKTMTTAPIQADIDDAFDQLWKVHKLQQSPYVLALAARRAYRRYEWKEALHYCQQLNLMDPAMTEASYSYVATLILLGHKRQLFRIAHEWVEAAPKSAPAWFAVGAYYYCCERYHVAQRHFCRATRLDPQCTEAWIAFGCSFAACDESDQALASFRAAQRLSPGEHSSLLYMGMEYVRTNHLVLAHYFLIAALNASGGDPLCLHEFGVLALQKGEYHNAIDWFHRALNALYGIAARSRRKKYVTDGGNFGPVDEEDDNDECILFDVENPDALEDMCQDPYWEPTLFNLGHAYRKSRRFEEAARCFNRCKSLCPDKFSAYSACGFTKHLMGDLDGAIEDYHQALSCKRDDQFSTEMLNRALKESMSNSTGFWSQTAAATAELQDRENKAANVGAAAPAQGGLRPPPPPSTTRKPTQQSQHRLFLSPGSLVGGGGARKEDSMMSEDMEECSDVDMSPT